MDDDGTGWNEVLVAGWTPAVRRAVVARVESLTASHRGVLVRALRDPEDARYAWTESIHRAVLTAIRDETGADLDELGSHAAWACYEEVWDALTATWGEGGSLAAVPLGQEPAVVALLGQLPAGVAALAAADVSTVTPDPLWIAGRLRIDVDALEALLASDDAGLSGADRLRVETLVERVAGTRS